MTKPASDNKNIIQVAPKPIKQISPLTINDGGLRIGKVNTLNLFIEPFKKRYHKHYKENKIHLIVDLILVMIIIALLGVLLNLWFFSRYQKNQLSFQVKSNPEQLTNGQETEFTIDYANMTKDELYDVTLVLKLPESLKNPQFNISDFNAKTSTLNLGTLAAKTKGEFAVKGLMLGNYQDKHEFIAAINYKNKYGQSRQEFFSQEFTLSDSVLKTQLQFPERVIANGIFTANLNLQNTSSLPFDTVKLKIQSSDNFNLRQIKLDKIGANTYLIGKIEPNQTMVQDFSAKIIGTKEATATITTEIIASYNSQEYILNRIDNTIYTSVSNLQLGFLNLDNNRNIAPGGTTTYTLYYKNNEKYALQNVAIGLALYGEYADTNYLAKNYKQATDNTVIFDKNKYPELAKIEPGQEGRIEIVVAAKKEIVFTRYTEGGYSLEATVLGSYDDPELKTRIMLESEPVFTKLDSNLILKTTALFYTSSGDQIGVGTLPPKVGEYISYWVIIKITNTNNRIKDLKVTAKVPTGIEYTYITNVTDGDGIIFDENTRTLSWSISNVTAFAGIFNPSPEARIQLAITPTEDQVDRSPLLLTDIKATATDGVTNAFLSANGANVSIAIFNDQNLNKVTQ